MPGDHDLVSGGDALEDADAVLVALAGLDESAGDLEHRLAVRVLAVLAHHEHGIAVEREVDRGRRDRHHLGRGRQHDADVGEHAGLQAVVGVGERCLHLDRARAGIDLRLDGAERGLEGAARIGIDGEQHFLPDGDLPALLLRQGEVHIEVVEVRERHHCAAGVDVLADLNLADAEHAVPGSADQLLRDDGLGLGAAGAHLVELRLILVDGRLRRVLPGQELARACQVELRELRLGAVVREVALVGLIIELHQRIACLHRGTRLEQDLGNEPADLAGDGDLMHRLQRADAHGIARHRVLLRLGHGDRGRRRLHRIEGIADRLGPERIEAVEPGSKHDQQPRHQRGAKPDLAREDEGGEPARKSGDGPSGNHQGIEAQRPTDGARDHARH